MSDGHLNAAAVTAAVVDIQAAGLPLAAALRMMAADVPDRRWAAALYSLARETERGVSLSQALEQPEAAGLLPTHLRGLLTSAAGRSDLPTAATEMIEIQRIARDERDTFLRSLAYPFIVVVLAAVVCLIFAHLITNYFEPMVREFGLKLSFFGESAYSAAHAVQYLASWGIPSLLVIGGTVVLLGGKRVTHGLACEIPLLGPVLLWSSTAEFLRGTALFIDENIPLPTALRWAGTAQPNFFIRAEVESLAEDIKRGESLAIAWSRHPLLPQSPLPLLKSAEKTSAPARLLRIAADLLSERLTHRAAVLTTILPPLLFILVAISTFMLFGSIMLPLISLLQGLSGS